MGVADALRAGIRVTDLVTDSLQAPVTLQRRTEQDGYGNAVYTESVVRGVVEQRQQKVMTAGGELVDVRASVTFPRPVAITSQDRLVLQDGTAGFVVKRDGVMDESTGLGFATVVYLG